MISKKTGKQLHINTSYQQARFLNRLPHGGKQRLLSNLIDWLDRVRTKKNGARLVMLLASGTKPEELYDELQNQEVEDSTEQPESEQATPAGKRTAAGSASAKTKK